MTPAPPWLEGGRRLCFNGHPALAMERIAVLSVCCFSVVVEALPSPSTQIQRRFHMVLCHCLNRRAPFKMSWQCRQLLPHLLRYSISLCIAIDPHFIFGTGGFGGSGMTRRWDDGAVYKSRGAPMCGLETPIFVGIGL